jgi:hypothetical protein
MTADMGKLIAAVEAGELRDDDWRLMAAIPRDFNAELVCAYHGSIDAAKALHDALLPGWFPGLSQNIHSGHWYAWVQTADVKHFSATEPDPARAWLLAILRAYREVME